MAGRNLFQEFGLSGAASGPAAPTPAPPASTDFPSPLAGPTADGAAAQMPAPSGGGGRNLFEDLGVAPMSGARLRRSERQGAASQSFLNEIRGRAPGVDYDSGTDWLDQAYLAAADNDAERFKYLGDKYGKDKVGRDPNGTFYVEKDGKKIVPSGGKTLSLLSAKIVAGAPQMVLGTAGAIGGAALGGPFAPATGAAGAGLGSAAGKLAQEGIKAATRGMVVKTPGEEAKAVGEEGAMGMLGEGAARAIGGVPRLALKRGLLGGEVRPVISGTTPESRALTASTTARGASPPLVSALPGMKITQFHQALAQKLFGSFGETRNIAYVASELERSLREAGVADRDVPGLMERILDPSSAISTRPLGERLTAKVADTAAGLRSGVERTQAALDAARAAQTESRATAQRAVHEAGLARFDAEIDARIGALDQRIQRAPGELATDVAGAIENERRALTAEARPLYEAIWRMAPGAILPVAPLSLEAQRLVAEIPAARNTVIGEIAGAEGNISLQQAHDLRTRLRELSRPANLAASGLEKGRIRRMSTQLDGMIGEIGERGDAAGGAVMMMRDVDAHYYAAIRRFEDAGINKLARDVRSGLPPDPEVTAQAILRPGFAARAREIRQIVGPEAWSRVAATDYRNMMQAATRNGRLDARALQAEIEKRGATFDVAHGPAEAAELRDLARRLALRPVDDVPIAALDAANLPRTLRAATQAAKALDKFTDEEWLASMAKPGFMKDRAMAHLVQPGEEDRLIRAISFFGEGSAEVAELRQTFLQQLLKKSTAPTPTGVGRTVGGDAMEGALAGYTPRQLELLLPGAGADLKRLAKEAKFLFPAKGGSDMVAGLAAGLIKSALPFGTVAGGAFGGTAGAVAGATPAAVAYAHSLLWGYLLSRPWMIRYLALGLENGPKAEATRQAFRAMARASARGLLPDVGGLASSVPLPDPDER